MRAVAVDHGDEEECMLQVAAMLSIYVSFALMYAADPERLPRGWSPGHRWGVLSRLAALGGVLLASGLFARSAGGRTEMLVILSAIMTVTTLFILLLSLWPKGMWALAWISPPLIVGLVAFGSF
jgi:hypothetical protein